MSAGEREGCLHHFKRTISLFLLLLCTYWQNILKNTFLRNRFSFVVFASHSQSTHQNDQIQWPLSHSLNRVTPSGIAGTSDWPTHKEKMQMAKKYYPSLAPYLFWDLNLHFVLNKSFRVHWQMSQAIFRGVTICQLRSTRGQSWLFSHS